MTQEVIKKINQNNLIKQGACAFSNNGTPITYLNSAYTTNSVEGFDNKLENSFNEYGVYWDDVKIAGTSFLNGATAPAMTQYNGSIYLPGYAASATVDQAFATIQLPHSWKIGTNLHPHVHWSPNVGGGTYDNQGVCWKVDYSLAPIGGVFGNPTTISGVDTWTTGSNGLTQYSHRIKELIHSNGNDEIQMTGINSVSSMILLRIYRDYTQTSDTFTQPAFLLEFDLHYQTDRPGSRSEYIK